jgi:hypothetical protein
VCPPLAPRAQASYSAPAAAPEQYTTRAEVAAIGAHMWLSNLRTLTPTMISFVAPEASACHLARWPTMNELPDVVRFCGSKKLITGGNAS